MKVNIKTNAVPYTGDDWGGAAEIVIFHIEGEREFESVSDWRKVVNNLNREIDNLSYSSNICSAYDCTGRPFGSSWRRLDKNVDGCNVDLVYVHGWAIDI